MDQFQLSVDEVLYSDLTDAQLLAIVRLKALTAQLEQSPTPKQIARFVSSKTIKNITNFDPTLIELETNSTLTQVERVVKKRGYSKTKMRQIREKQTDVTGNLPDCYTDINKIKENKIKESKKDTNVSKKEPKNKYGEFKNVLLSKNEHEQLVERFGASGTDAYIERLGGYIGSTGKVYKSHYMTILNWSKKDLETPKPKANSINSHQAENYQYSDRW